MDPETRDSLIARLPDHADSEAWLEFVDLYEPLIYGIGRRHGLQASDANDLVQEVLAAVATSIERFHPDRTRGRFRSWLFGVARNHALIQIRKLDRTPTVAGGSDVHAQLEDQPGQSVCESEFDSAFRRRAFRWAARRVRGSVRPATWDCFARTAIDGQSPQSVAMELGIEVGGVYLARSRVMARLRKMVQEVSAETIAYESGDSAQELTYE